jgi:hypothetical protein
MGLMDGETRCIVPTHYLQKFDDSKPLRQVIQSKCSSNRDYSKALQFLAVNPCEAKCYMLDLAMKGFGTNEMLVYSIICGRSNTEMTLLKKEYFHVFTKDLGSSLDSELGGNVEQLILNCLQANQEEYNPDEIHTSSKMEEDCEAFYHMAQGKFGMNEKDFLNYYVCYHWNMYHHSI